MLQRYRMTTPQRKWVYFKCVNSCRDCNLPSLPLSESRPCKFSASETTWGSFHLLGLRKLLRSKFWTTYWAINPELWDLMTWEWDYHGHVKKIVWPPSMHLTTPENPWFPSYRRPLKYLVIAKTLVHLIVHLKRQSKTALQTLRHVLTADESVTSNCSCMMASLEARYLHEKPNCFSAVIAFHPALASFSFSALSAPTHIQRYLTECALQQEHWK